MKEGKEEKEMLACVPDTPVVGLQLKAAAVV